MRHNLETKIIDGKKISEEIKIEIANDTKSFKNKFLVKPGLAVVLVGNDPASSVYVRNKEKSAIDSGMRGKTINLPSTVSEQDLLNIIENLNLSNEIHGILVQLPLPSHISQEKIVEKINPIKDVDGLHPFNSGLLSAGTPRFIPATPAGIRELLIRSDFDTDGKHVAILGRSNIVGRPLANLLSMKSNGGNATVSLCHSRTNNLKDITQMADIIVAAIGIPNFVTKEMVKENAVVIDVGINRVESSLHKRGYRLVGDVEFETVKLKCKAITPVPGGVGPMTIAMLLSNTLQAAKLQCA